MNPKATIFEELTWDAPAVGDNDRALAPTRVLSLPLPHDPNTEEGNVCPEGTVLRKYKVVAIKTSSCSKSSKKFLAKGKGDYLLIGKGNPPPNGKRKTSSAKNFLLLSEHSDSSN